MEQEPTQRLLADIDEMLSPQVKWRSIMSISYFLMAVLAIGTSAAATIFSGLGMADWATISAAAATALLGMEKTLLLRERWNHHVRTAASLTSVRLQVDYNELKADEAIKKLANINRDYADGMSFDRSDQRNVGNNAQG